MSATSGINPSDAAGLPRKQGRPRRAPSRPIHAELPQIRGLPPTTSSAPANRIESNRIERDQVKRDRAGHDSPAKPPLCFLLLADIQAVRVRRIRTVHLQAPPPAPDTRQRRARSATTLSQDASLPASSATTHAHTVGRSKTPAQQAFDRYPPRVNHSFRHHGVRRISLQQDGALLSSVWTAPPCAKATSKGRALPRSGTLT